MQNLDQSNDGVLKSERIGYLESHVRKILIEEKMYWALSVLM